jgi:micrococcal nuclease
MKYSLLLILGLLITLIGCRSPQVATIPARVERVLSGQAIEVTLLNQEPPERRQIRLAGIDAPDRRQTPWGTAAQEKLTALIAENNPQKLVQLELPAASPAPNPAPPGEGRTLAHLWRNRVLLSQELVKAGYVLAKLPKETDELTPNKYQTQLLQAQDQARIMGVGIWEPSQPLRLEPSEFRKYNKSSPSSPQ